MCEWEWLLYGSSTLLGLVSAWCAPLFETGQMLLLGSFLDLSDGGRRLVCTDLTGNKRSPSFLHEPWCNMWRKREKEKKTKERSTKSSAAYLYLWSLCAGSPLICRIQTDNCLAQWHIYTTATPATLSNMVQWSFYSKQVFQPIESAFESRIQQASCGIAQRASACLHRQ